MSTYLGSPSLSTAVKDRVSSTFQQTLALYKQGRIDEVVAGCNLILQMDPMFDPARKLLEKARNPNAPIDVDTLGPAAPTVDAIQMAKESMANRDFQRVIHITTEILTNDLMNDAARILGDEAREKMEAAPFIDQFQRKFDEQIASGNITAARGTLEKARALDPEHPAIKKMERTAGSASAAAPATPSSSFVVDTPAPPAQTGRGTAQASDFGFTFEEDKPPESSFANFAFDSPASPAAPASDGFSSFSFGETKPAAAPPPATPAPFGGGFSFDSPAATSPAAPASSGFGFDTPAKPPASGEFDFSTASIETSADDQKKIDQYLADGDRAFNAGDYQQAIDLWSRIFLIDVTSEAASERIERAKAKRREAEQKIEDALASAVQAYDRRDYDGARARFADVLRIDPTNTTAEEYLERLTSVTEGGAAATVSNYTPSAPTPVNDDLFGAGFEDEPYAGTDLPLMPPESSAGPAAKTKASGKAAAKPKEAKKPLPMGALAAIIGVLVLGGAGWFAWQKFAGGDSTTSDPAATEALLARATSLAKRGKYDEAIELLQDVKPGDPNHDKALGMIADLSQKKSQTAAMIDGMPAATYYENNLLKGQAALEAHDYETAKLAFENAMKVKPLPPDVKASYDAAAQQVGKLEGAKSLFKEQRYQDAITALQPLHDADPQNKNIQRLISDAHFNLGAKALQESNTTVAVKEFDAVLQMDPSDELAQRSKSLAQRYEKEKKDLLYTIYVKYLPMRRTAS